MVSKAGGIDYLLKKISSRIRNKRSAQMGIASLVSVTNMAIANNTVSIIISGPIAKEISEAYKLDKRKSAALLDIFSCVFQGLLPYGAQVLLLTSFAKGNLSYLDLLTNSWYLLVLPLVTLISIYWPTWDRFLRGDSGALVD